MDRCARGRPGWLLICGPITTSETTKLAAFRVRYGWAGYCRRADGQPHAWEIESCGPYGRAGDAFDDGTV